MNFFKILTTTALVLGTSSAWADLIREDSTACSPTIHLKLPLQWRTAYLAIGDTVVPFPKADAKGWTTISLADKNAVGTKDATKFFINNNPSRGCSYNSCLSPEGIYKSIIYEQFTCSSFKEDKAEVWIQEHPDPRKQGQIYMAYQEPVIHDFYVFVPQNKNWFVGNPILDENGKLYEMSPDPQYCGWYYRRYIDEEIPDNVLIYHEGDDTKQEGIGMNGEWETNATPTAIPLNSLFEILSAQDGYNNAIYFIADKKEASKLPAGNDGWYIKHPTSEGSCMRELIATVYDSDASLHGAFSCAPAWTMAREASGKSNYNACYYPTAKYSTTAAPDTVIPCIGVTTGIVESSLDPTTKKLKLTEKGKACFGAQADEAFAALFTSTPGINETYTYELPIYKNFYGKLEFDSDYYTNPGTNVPGGFYPAEVSPSDEAMKSERLPAAESKRRAEGPVFYCPDPTKNSPAPEGLRTIDTTRKVAVNKLICNGPGWDGGTDCEGNYVKGGEFSMNGTKTPWGKEISEKFGISWIEDGWGWSCLYYAPIDWPHYKDGTEIFVSSQDQGNNPRWNSFETGVDMDTAIMTTAGRNQHFCLESHAKFQFRKGLNFSISGNDDIWVYINNKLAVDIGGVHIPAPGYVDLDKFLPTAKAGDIYDIDIYFCNRRNPTSTLQISTNMLLDQLGTLSNPDAIAGRRISSNELGAFRIFRTGSLEIAIIAGMPAKAKQYTVMDMKGQVMHSGTLNSKETRVKLQTAGTYIVKVGRSYKKVSVK